jgi:hypothetical protein
VSAPATADAPFPKEKVEAALHAELARTALWVDPFAQLQQHNLGMTTQVLPGVAGAQSFNAQQLTQTVPEFYTSMHRQ